MMYNKKNIGINMDNTNLSDLYVAHDSRSISLLIIIISIPVFPHFQIITIKP